MKKIIYTLFLISSLTLVAQDNINYDGIFMGSYIPEQMEYIPSPAKRMLGNKLTQIITNKGISDNNYNSRFIITPNITVLTKNVTPTAPPKVVLNLEVTLYIGDGIEGTMFTNETLEVKGVGTNENKAYIAAIRQIKPKSPVVQAFVKKGKKRIIEYYNDNCNLVIKKVDALNGQNKFDDALAILAGVPEVSSCFNKIKAKMLTTYNKSIEYDCKTKLAEAQGIWDANQDINAANEAAALLASVEPGAPCFSKVKSLYSKIAARVKDLSDRNWNYKLKVLDVEKSRIKAARDVGVAYGKNQKQTTYNVRGWY
ncbi:hypothetical protein Q4Q34_08910 [Flavivirga abyssicola]|uniref:hypothetical protein n=1 Tax=Flavivirga abyssicola TaxID=3063533 RepID=UPI0026E0878F|nr:hypothetical protein [Flavivirga sp. MEBiC07777]WVK15147.1 hypothetical protein Q4Q34_08910 [Flavivirga sp. MEBiC07777]